MAKKQRYTPEFRRMAVGRMKVSDNVATLARELKIPRQTLYVWKDRQEAVELRQEQAAGRIDPSAEEKKEMQRLKKLLAEQALALDFFKGALQKVEARRPASSGAGETLSTRK